jgi:hypothetical protein
MEIRIPTSKLEFDSFFKGLPRKDSRPSISLGTPCCGQISEMSGRVTYGGFSLEARARNRRRIA